MGKKTVLYEEHVRLGARMVDFHGWDLPVQYGRLASHSNSQPVGGILAEHRHCREAACLFDTSHMGQILIRARPADLGRVTTQNAAALAVGQDAYGFLLNPDWPQNKPGSQSAAGGILDDTILMRLGEEEFLLVVNAGTAASDFEWVAGHLPRAELTDQRAEGWAKLDLQGPAAARVLAPATDADLPSLRYFHVVRTRVCGRSCILSRTGYTGELGYEIFAPGESILAIFRELPAVGGGRPHHPQVRPAGLGARDSLRLEMGYPLHGADIGPDTTPLEAALGGFVRLDHDFIGAAALEAAGPPERLRVAFVVGGRQRAWAGNEVWKGDRPAGRVTSAAFSPCLKTSIGMAYVPPDLTDPGESLTVKTPRGDLDIVVADTPLYKHGTCRTKEPL